ncbi:hypothetical protein Tsubulata_020794 [Turnera subulata]|uniref:Uncharacterized protein n=1 Tax=Turnera subulata TaxID=218843 RepID=A0A9Q0J5W3_9ROSI|nr:hypothetical protein Tsubulata_020794 [Turnera subulata]
MEDPLDEEKLIREPLLGSNTKGGLRTLPFIIANEAMDKLAASGLMANMILYLTREYGLEAAKGAQVIYLRSAASFFPPLPGAFLADSYVGRYRMIVSGSICSLLVISLIN